MGFWILTCTPPPGLQDHLQFPPDVPDVPASAQDLIRQLLCRQEERLGHGGLDDFRNHPFFEGIDWERLATSTAPYIPELRGPMDTSNFDVDDDTLKHPVSGGAHSSGETALNLSGCGTLPRTAKFPKAVGGLGMRPSDPRDSWELWFTWAGSPALRWVVPSEGPLTTSVILLIRNHIRKKTPSSTWEAGTSKTYGSCSFLRVGGGCVIPLGSHLSRRRSALSPRGSPGSRASAWSCTCYRYRAVPFLLLLQGTLPPPSHGTFLGHHLPFVGFTYTSGR